MAEANCRSVSGPTFRWISACVVRYAVVFMVGWMAVSLTAPRMSDRAGGYGARKTLWGSFLGYMEGAPGMFLMIGVPSLILLALISRRRGTSAPDEFRAFAAALLVIPALVLFLAGTWVMVAIQVVVQILFAAIIMPVARKKEIF
ncbi:hypothetical protein ACFV6D_29820 [Kitasatospora sp. NPDC059812]|uniref:hypothetical protein n=1 Tax=Kitasatospora sp. NPDC059812 TaxID=3346958 RepID=UPI00364986A8